MGSKSSKETTPKKMEPENATSKSTYLVIVDPQVDFHEGGSLAVAGATADSKRLAQFITTNAENIAGISVTMDTHQRLHVGNALYWVNAEGASPAPFTIISSEDITAGKWKASIPENEARAAKYVKDLEAGGQFKVCIWPDHCIAGTAGHNVQLDVMNAIDHWARTTKSAPNFIFKGQNEHTEAYSALKAEVPNEDPSTHLNTAAINLWDSYDRVLFSGEAASHCVNFTCRDFVANRKNAEVVVLSNCTSAVGGFEKAADCFFNDMKATDNVSVMTCDEVTF